MAGAVIGLLVGALAWQVGARDEERRTYSGEMTSLDGLVPARKGSTFPPGTPLGAGLRVAKGSYLLGGPLPHLYSTMHRGGERLDDEGFEAHLLATEPIREVLGRYRSQAVDAGFEMAPVTCRGTAADLSCDTSCQVECGFDYSTGYEHGRSLSIAGQQRGPGTGPPVSYVFIDHQVLGDPPYPTADWVTRPDETTERGSVPLDWPPLPKVGDPIYSFNDFKVARGTILLAHGIGDDPSEATAIFEVIGDVDSVIEGFTAQPKRSANAGPVHEVLERAGVRIDIVYWSDGHSQMLVFHHLPDGPTILVLSSYIAD